jgi:hypothetical protein
MSPVLLGPPCMRHGPFQMGLAMWTSQGNTYARSSWSQITFMQPSNYRLRGNSDIHSISKVISKRSCCPFVTLWRPPACLLAGVPCSRYLSQALVVTVWCTPNATLTWRKVVPCCIIPTALHNSASLKCCLMLASVIRKWQMQEM